jgi:hypothetical protein
MPVPDIEIWRTAKILIVNHGDDAHLIAANRADELLAASDFEGVIVWKRILAAIIEWRQAGVRALPN